ncbi:TetR family transcriptional regulator [Rhodococcus chondri]|uniref:TetR family transcriptional regulator n=1 Tax=Rhodococcus chondri TaxID=3065941 RepID=A0ABU7JQR4_9NOCA|nr:TetR family transcriptional regulator [Rhodococcus sp. CC-R104]MEE2032375.1 TetR family transcriptional regulator [Rhodococcus sp. CC-R104]
MSVAPAPEPTTRAARKERTRQTLLDTALELSGDRSFAGISLREVTRQAGIVPTAFYRHFGSMEELGVALAADTMRVLRGLLRDARRNPGPANARDSLAVLVREVRAHERAFRFLARERYGGQPTVAHAITTELRLLTSELAVDLARTPGLSDWDVDDLEMAADLLVTAVLEVVLELLAVDRPGGAAEAEVVARGEKQMRLIMLGMAAWKPRRA